MMNLLRNILLFPALICLAFSGKAQVENRSGEDSTIFISHTVFLPRESLASGEQNWCIESADINGDGRTDLIVGAQPEGNIHIHLGEGGGTFSPGPVLTTSPYNRAVVVFDANGDQRHDLASVTMKGYLNIFANHGEQGFKEQSPHKVGGLLQDIEAIDIDRDGDQDLLIAGTTHDEIIWYRNEANFRFSRAGSWPTGKDPRSIALGDLNMDGQTDMVVGCDDGQIYLYLGESGGFRRWGKNSSGAANWSVVIADLNGDGRNDIATASYLDKWLSIHLNRGSNNFPASQQVLSGDHNFDLAPADFDLDGDLDLVTCSTLDKAIGFHLNDGSGHFSRRHSMQSGNWNAGLTVSDVDEDGDPDVVVASINDHQIHIHRNISNNPDQEETKEYVCLSGFVLDAESHQKLNRAAVSLRKEGRTVETMMSDENGFFEFCQLSPGKYSLSGRSPGYDVGEVAFSMPKSNHQQDILLRKPAPTYLYGLVTDQVSRELIPGATVIITNEAREELFQLRTDHRGRYKTAIHPGNYHLSATQEGYSPDNRSVTVDPPTDGRGTRADLALTSIPTDACLSGTVYDKETNDIIPGARIAIRDTAGNPIRKIQANDQGAFRACLPFGRYQFSTTAEGYFFNVEEVEIQEPDPESQLTRDIYLQPLKKDAHFVLEHIHYDVNKATLRPESIEELERVTDILQNNPSLVVSIEGHTDSDATDAYNLDLSDRRAASVVNYLTEAEIESSRLLYEGFGERRPVAPNDSPENKQLNRRTELRVVSYE